MALLVAVGYGTREELYHHLVVAEREQRPLGPAGAWRDERPDGEVLVPFGAEWTWRSSWRAPEGWDEPGAAPDAPRGRAPLGYGYPELSTRIPYGVSSCFKAPRLTLRCELEVPEPGRYRALDVGAWHDAGLEVRLNGTVLVEWGRPEPGERYASRYNRGAPVSWFASLPPLALRAGRNVLVVTVWISEPRASSLRADVCLVGVSAPRLAGPPYLRERTPTGAQIQFTTDIEARMAVEVTAPGKSPVRVESGPAVEHQVWIEGEGDLTYRILGGHEGGRWTGPYPVPVPRTSPGPRVAVYGDSRANPDVHRWISSCILEGRPALVVHTGDLVTYPEEDRAWDAEWLEPAGSWLAAVPALVVPGNHDRRPDQPDPEAAFRRHAPPVRPVRVGPAAFVPLASTVPLEEGDPRLAALDAALQEVEDVPFVFVVQHEPARSLGRYRLGPRDDLREREIPLLRRHRVTAVLAGHEHNYERLSLDGILWVITGGGGAWLAEISAEEPGVVARAVHHYCQMDFTDASCTVEALTPDGECVDRFTLEPRRPRRPR